MTHPISIRGGSGNHRFLNTLQASRWRARFAGKFIWTQTCEVINGAIGAVALTATAGQIIDLHVAFPFGESGLFPDDAMRMNAYIWKITDFAGGTLSNVQVEVGYAADPDALLTVTSVFTGVGNGLTETLGAAESAHRVQASSTSPSTRLIGTGDNVDALTSGKLMVCIEYSPIHQQPT